MFSIKNKLLVLKPNIYLLIPSNSIISFKEIFKNDGLKTKIHAIISNKVIQLFFKGYLITETGLSFIEIIPIFDLISDIGVHNFWANALKIEWDYANIINNFDCPIIEKDVDDIHRDIFLNTDPSRGYNSSYHDKVSSNPHSVTLDISTSFNNSRVINEADVSTNLEDDSLTSLNPIKSSTPDLVKKD